MPDNQRIEGLRRRVQKDPASIAFAQLAEECRRAGQAEEAVDVCRAGLAIHPGYLSARVTLGRALIELNALDDALDELTTVLRGAPENLAAIRGIAEIHHRRGDLAEALAQYRVALAFARNDPDLQQTVAELARQVEPPPPSPEEPGLSFEEIANEFLNFAPPPPVPAPVATASQDAPPSTPPTRAAEAEVPPSERALELDQPLSDAAPEAAPPLDGRGADVASSIEQSPVQDTASLREPPTTHEWAPSPAATHASPAHVESEDNCTTPVSPSPDDSGAREERMRTIAALEQWLTAIHVTRAHRSP